MACPWKLGESDSILALGIEGQGGEWHVALVVLEGNVAQGCDSLSGLQ